MSPYMHQLSDMLSALLPALTWHPLNEQHDLSYLGLLVQV